MIRTAAQFTIRQLFAVSIACASGLGLWVAEPSWQLGILEAFLSMAVPTIALVSFIRAAEQARAFHLGVLFSTTMVAVSNMTFVAFWSLQFTHEEKESGIIVITSLFEACALAARPVLVLWALVPVVGLVAVMSDWFLARSDG